MLSWQVTRRLGKSLQGSPWWSGPPCCPGVGWRSVDHLQVLHTQLLVSTPWIWPSGHHLETIRRCCPLNSRWPSAGTVPLNVTVKSRWGGRICGDSPLPCTTPSPPSVLPLLAGSCTAVGLATNQQWVISCQLVHLSTTTNSTLGSEGGGGGCCRPNYCIPHPRPLIC